MADPSITMLCLMALLRLINASVRVVMFNSVIGVVPPEFVAQC